MQSTYGHFLWQGGQTLELNGIYKNCTTIVNGHNLNKIWIG